MADRVNPFNPNSVVAPNLFAGRTDQVLSILKKISQLKNKTPASFFIYGERGIGKTALVKLVKHIGEANDSNLYSLNLLTSYYIVESGQELGSVLEESLNKLTAKMDQGLLDALGKKLGNLFKNGKFSIGAYGFSASAEMSEGNKKEITVKDQSVAILESVISSLVELKGKEKRDGVLIIIDEMHNLKDLKKAASILRNIMTTLDVDDLGSVSFLLVGYKEDMEDFFAGDPSARRSFDPLPLDTMPDKEALEVLTKGLDEACIVYDKRYLEGEISLTGGYPHSIQLIGHNLVLVDKDSNISDDDWNEAVFNTAVELQSKDFSKMYSFNRPLRVRDKIIKLLAEKNEPLSLGEIKSGLGGVNVYQCIPELKKSGAIRQNENDQIYLQSQLFRTAVLLDGFLRIRKLKADQEKTIS